MRATLGYGITYMKAIQTSASIVRTSEPSETLYVPTVDVYSQRTALAIVRSESCMIRTKNKEKHNIKNNKFNCSDGIVRTMEEIGMLTRKGIKTSITRKPMVNRKPNRKPIPQDKIIFPKKLTGSKQWCE